MNQDKLTRVLKEIPSNVFWDGTFLYENGKYVMSPPKQQDKRAKGKYALRSASMADAQA